jgi:filamentous hemagglutinin family protein
MKLLSKGKQKIVAGAIILSLQLPTLACYAAAVTPDASAAANAPAVTEQSGVPVVAIVKPNENGLSHNKFTDFNVDTAGLIFNNNAGSTAITSRLAGQINPNAGLGGQAAGLILSEVTGNNISRLNGMIEVAGTRAGVIIANPNGIVGNGFGFINTSRASLVTGTPNIVGGNIDSFTITGGKVTIEGAGNAPDFDEATGTYVHEPVSKLDIMARAAAINADLWAQDELNVITGANTVNYATLAATPIENPPADKKPDLALDIAALGGMYAGKIQLVGTEKGLGFNVQGDIYANNSLAITNDGKITFTQTNKQYIGEDGEPYIAATGIASEGSIRVDSTAAIENKGQLAARKDITINAAGALTNQGTIRAGASYEENEDDPESAVITEAADLTLTGGGKITNGGMLAASSNVTVAGQDTFANSGQVIAEQDLNITAAGTVNSSGALTAGGAVTLTGEKVKYTPQGVTGASIQVTETNPATKPEPEPPAEGKDPETVPPDLPASPNLPGVAASSAPADTVHVAKDDNLRLTADAKAAGQYQPIIDKTASGVDLVQIAQANASGVSRNLYTDFNIKSTGLILNNSATYVKTELGGYIDRNTNIAGNGAGVILNEITSSNASVLNGYLEVAGNKASVVIANANGISVNGLGFINTANAVLATAKVNQWENGRITFGVPHSDLFIQGDGLNARTTAGLSLITNQFTVDKSEIWAHDLDIAADGTLKNTGKIAADQNIAVRADRLTNTENGYIDAAGNIAVTVNKDIAQDNATMHAGGSISMSGQQLQNKNNAMINGNGDIDITVAGSVDNTKAVIQTEQNLTVQAADFANTDTALAAYGQNGQFTIQNKITNTNATMAGNGSTIIRTGAVENASNAVIKAGKDLKVQATQGIVQDQAILAAGGDAAIAAASFSNANKSLLAADGNITLQTSGDIVNDAATIRAGKTASIAGDNITNQNEGALLVDGAMDSSARNTFANTKGLIAAGGAATVAAQTINNTQNSVLYAGGDITLTAAGTVLNQSSDLESQGNIKIKATDLVNEKEIFQTDWIVTDELISYNIPYAHLGGDYYNGLRAFNRNIHTGSITQETAAAHILANGNIDIEGNVANHYSTISAGKDLTITGDKIENWGYQGTIHHDDYGNDNYYWKYKKHRKFHHHCRMVYGTTIVPYEDHNVYEQEVERLSVLGANGKVTLHAAAIDNKTFEAGGEVITFKTKNSTAAITDKLSGQNPELDISALKVNTLVFTINTAPNAKYLVETNEKFADYHNFLSSDYLLNRIKADPEKVAKRLGDGYYEQKLVTEQLTSLTGKRFLDGYNSDLEQYKALMENGAVAAEQMNLAVGVGLTAEQVASLTSDIVWLVEETVNGQKVLVPEVYLATLKAGDLNASGALIVGGDIELYAKQDITNIGTIKADKTVTAGAENITNAYGKIKGNDIDLSARDTIKNVSGEISGQNDVTVTANNIINQTATKESQYRELEQTTVGDTALITAGAGSLRLDAQNDITNQGAVLSAGKDVTLKAGNNIDITSVAAEKHVAVAYPQSSLSLDTVTHQQSVIVGGNITLDAGRDISLSGALTSAEDKTTLTAGQDITISAVKDRNSMDSTVGKRGGRYFTHDKTVDETVVGTQIGGTQDITVQAGRDITVQGSSISSETGKVELTGESVTISGETEYHERLHEEHREKVGFLSSKKTDIYDRQTLEGVVGSSISGNSAAIAATGKDLTISGSSVVADKDVSLKAEGNVNITSQAETSSSDYQKQVKKSGLLSGGGFGFTIGKEKQKDTYANQNTEQAGSTIGSIDGNVTIAAGKDVTIAASDIMAGQDISLTGENVTIESQDNTYNAQEKHEYKKSGLTVALGGKTMDAINKVAAPLERATQVQDDRLAALYVYKAYDELTDKDKDTKKDLEGIKDPAHNFTIEVSLGTQKSKSQAQSSSTLAQGSNITAQGDVNIHATKEDINIHGSNVSGENVNLKAQENINITASDNTNTSDETSKSSKGSIGVSISASGISGINAGYNQAKGEIKENSTVYNQSSVTARDTLTLESGQDTNIIGSKVSGDTVKADVGENLNIESLQAQETYDEKNSSSGMGISVDLTQKGKTSIQGSASKGKIESDYQSVTEQAGIYAGEGGFDINVGKNTDLKGAVISSEAEAEKNRISTDTLTYSDIENKAEYKANSVGVNVNTSKNAEYNEKGVTPNIGVTGKGDADSTTKSAVSEGTIEVRSNPQQDLSGLSRNTTNSLNALGKIFDKKTVEEQQELAALFGEIAFKEIHKISEKNGWKDGSPEKVALHAVVGGIMSQLTGSGFKAGAIGAGVNELVEKELKEKFRDQPDVWQWASYVIGAAAAKAVDGDAQAGGSAAASGTKNNSQGYGYPKVDGSTIISTIIVAGVAYNVKKAIDGTVYLVNEAGKAIANWDEEASKWVGNPEITAINQQYIDTLNNYIQQANVQISKTEGTIQLASDIIRDTKQVIADTQRQIADLQTQIANDTAATAELQVEINQLQIDINERQKTIEGLEKDIATLQAQKSELLKKLYPPGTDTKYGQGTTTTVFPNNGDQTTTTVPPIQSNAPDSTVPPISPTDGNNKQIALENLLNPTENIIINASAGETGVIWPSKPHANGTEGHWDTILEEVNEMVKSGLYDKIYVNKGIGNEIPGAKPNNRPDIMGVRKDGKIDQVEVPSKTDSTRDLYDRMEKNKEILGDRAGDIKIKNIKE